jgi:hypothetical protein
VAAIGERSVSGERAAIPPAPTIRLDKVWLSPDYCGCCGQPAGAGGDALWCEPCRDHVGAVGHPWDRTFFALTGAECPFQVRTER